MLTKSVESFLLSSRGTLYGAIFGRESPENAFISYRLSRWLDSLFGGEDSLPAHSSIPPLFYPESLHLIAKTIEKPRFPSLNATRCESMAFAQRSNRCTFRLSCLLICFPKGSSIEKSYLKRGLKIVNGKQNVFFTFL
jgi:hypothetical protein